MLKLTNPIPNVTTETGGFVAAVAGIAEIVARLETGVVPAAVTGVAGPDADPGTVKAPAGVLHSGLALGPRTVGVPSGARAR